MNVKAQGLVRRMFECVTSSAEIRCTHHSHTEHMSISSRFRFALLLGVVVTQACNPIYYSPNTQLVPLLSGKGDHSIAIAGNNTRGELQAAYAVGNQFALGVTGGRFRQKDNSSGDGGSGTFGEVAVGYFQNITDHVVFEAYGLYGMGNVENHFKSSVAANPGTDGKIAADLTRFGVQPALGYRGKLFEAAISARVASLSYSNPQGTLVFDRLNQANYLKSNDQMWLAEPALTLRAGAQFLKLQLQIGRSVNLTNSDFRQDKSHATIGIVYRPSR